MRTLGMIGGLGPESTIDYYRRIITAWREHRPGYPSLIINSLDVEKVLGFAGGGQLNELAAYLLEGIQKLARARADFGLISANLPHLVFDEVQRQSPIPLISIVETACREAEALGLTKLGLLGARFTMQGHFYPDVFSREGIRMVVPGPEDQEYVHDKYTNEMLMGRFLPETRAGLMAVIARLRERHAIDGLVLGGTELPLLLRGSDPGIPMLDTTQLHVRAALKELLA